MWYEWDEKKYRSNIKKHGIRFDEAIIAFSDPFALEMNDKEFPDRLLLLGFSFYKGILVIVFSETDDVRRIISVRKANKAEEKTYAEKLRFQ